MASVLKVSGRTSVRSSSAGGSFSPAFGELLESVWCFSVGAYAAHEYWRSFQNGCCTHDFFSEVW